MLHNEPFALVLMPFNSSFDDIYEYGIRAACTEEMIKCERVDEQQFEDHVVEQIYDQIRNADVIVADLTHNNVNVYYELGFARAMRKRIITLVNDIAQVPFDLRSYPHIVYGHIRDLKPKLREKLRWALEAPLVSADIYRIYDRSADIQIDLPKFAASCKQEIVCFGVHFNMALSDRRTDLLNALKVGVDITIVMLDPKANAVKITAETYGMNYKTLKKECEMGVELASAFIEDHLKTSKKSDKPGKLTIFLSGQLPRARYYLFDPNSKSGIVVFTPYVEQLRSSHSPSYAFRASAPIGKTYIESCRESILQASPVELKLTGNALNTG